MHGFQIVGTNVNLTVAPGYVSEVTTTFDTPGEYLVVCNEYCGLAHHLMQGTVVVEAGAMTPRPPGSSCRTSGSRWRRSPSAR